MGKKASTISITLSDLSRASQFLVVLGNLKKDGTIALDISNYRIRHVTPHITAASEAEEAVFKAADVEPNEQGVYALAPTDSRHDDVAAQLTAVRERRVEIPVFPVTAEALVKSATKYSDNPISENLLVELNVLYVGSPEKVAH